MVSFGTATLSARDNIFYTIQAHFYTFEFLQTRNEHSFEWNRWLFTGRNYFFLLLKYKSITSYFYFTTGKMDGWRDRWHGQEVTTEMTADRLTEDLCWPYNKIRMGDVIVLLLRWSYTIHLFLQLLRSNVKAFYFVLKSFNYQKML